MKTKLGILVVTAFMISAFAIGSTAFACGGGDDGGHKMSKVAGDVVE